MVRCIIFTYIYVLCVPAEKVLCSPKIKADRIPLAAWSVPVPVKR